MTFPLGRCFAQMSQFLRLHHFTFFVDIFRINSGLFRRKNGPPSFKCAQQQKFHRECGGKIEALRSSSGIPFPKNFVSSCYCCLHPTKLTAATFSWIKHFGGKQNKSRNGNERKPFRRYFCCVWNIFFTNQRGNDLNRGELW